MNPLTTHPKDGNYVLFVEKIDELGKNDSLLDKSIDKYSAELEDLHKKEKSLTYYSLPDAIKKKYPDVTADDIQTIAPNAKHIRPLSFSDLSTLALILFHVEYEDPGIFKLSFNQRHLGLQQLCTEMRDRICQEIFKTPATTFIYKREEILRCFQKDYEPKIIENGAIYPYSSWLLKQSFNPEYELKFKIVCAFHYKYE